MDPKVKHLLSLRAVRERSKLVGEAAQAGKLSHFDLHEERLPSVADYVTNVIKRDFGPDRFNTIPPHGRWQHFEVGDVPRINQAIEEWKSQGCDDVEVTRRLIDLFFVSVILDAGAGDHWRYVEQATSKTFERSEGIAVASLHMFLGLKFKAGEMQGMAPVVDGKGLESLKTEALAEGFQISKKNPILGLESRADMLRRLGKSLLAHPEVFGTEGRPGNVVDYMTSTSKSPGSLDILIFWDILQDLLIPIWPSDRTSVAGQPIGDAWPLSTLKTQQAAMFGQTSADETLFIQPFHKLTQWLTYSLMVPFQRILGLTWINADSLTALPEYRNGGLFVDLGVLSLKPEALEHGLKASGGGGSSSSNLPMFGAGDDVVVEWRAMTLVLIDKLYAMVLEKMAGTQLSMAQLLEAGTWKSGREVAREKRPETKSSPIIIESDGTVF